MGAIAITGANGYVGSRLTSVLAERDRDVRALVRERVPWIHVEQHECELGTDGARATLEQVLDGVETVIHLAGENEVVAARNPAAALGSTVIATEQVAEACAAAGAGRFVYLSTMHVYGRRIVPGAVLTEDLRPEPRAAYGISRLASEHLAASLADGSYELVVLRLTNAVGAPYDPNVDRWTLVANDLCRQGAQEGRLELRTSGVQWRDFVSLAGACSAIASACEPDVPGGTYNLGSGQPTTVRSLAGMIQDAFERRTGTRPELRAPDPEGDAPEPYRVSVERAAECGLRPEDSLESAVDETVAFCLEQLA